MAINLGKWALIDIETSGVNPEDDSIIDVGFLVFDETNLVRKFSSLVKFPMTSLHHSNYSKFIEKLTGISPRMLKNAPIWEEVLPEVRELQGMHLVAHNAQFENNFLSPWLSFQAKSSEHDQETTYEDSLHYLSLLHPERSGLKLDDFIKDYGVRESELHRGYEDSLDLLKVLLAATYKVKKDREMTKKISELLFKYHIEDWWFAKFFNLDHSELEAIASQIDFDMHESVEIFIKARKENSGAFKDYSKLPGVNSTEFSKNNISDIFKDEETIRNEIPKYKFRQSQLDLAVRTGQALKSNTHALIQAPTGTGKTLGYLIPSALFALSEKQPVLVATGTKALQEQAMSKDIPLLKTILGEKGKDLKIKRLIGSSNHLCESLFQQEAEEDSLFFQSADFESKFTFAFYDLVFWHNQHTSSNPILRNDVPFVFKRKIDLFNEKDKNWAVDFRSCSGKNCPYKNSCSYVNGLKEAKDADIIVGNHALMYSWPKSLARPAHIVIDEAHKIEHETTTACSLEVSNKELEKIHQSLKNMQGVGSLFYLLAQSERNSGESTPVINEIRNTLVGYSSMLDDQLPLIKDQAEKYFKKMPRYTSIYWNELPLDRKLLERDFSGKKIVQHLESTFNILSLTMNLLLPHASRFEAKSFNDDSMIKAWTRFENFFQQLNEVISTIDDIFKFSNQKQETKTQDLERTNSFKYHEEYGYSFNCAPINVGKVIHDSLLQTSQSVVFTSATLGNAHGNVGSKGVEWATGYLYLPNDRRFKTGLYLPSVFDYKNKTKVYLCDDTPVLWSDDFIEKTLSQACRVTQDIGGRSLFLFSAKTRFEKAREYLLDKFEGTIPTFIQGMSNNIVDEFKKSERGILIGMESLGEGIDIPGDGLQFVFIDKIPDLRMDLVINDRRDFFEKTIGNEFSDYYLSNRTRALHQKLGRLIRTDDDFGGVIIVDSRIKRWKGRTIETLNRLMEPYRIERSNLKDACDSVTSFLKSTRQ